MIQILAVLAGAAVMAATAWLTNFFYHLRTPVEKLLEGGDDARKFGFRLGFLLAVFTALIVMRAADPHAPLW